MYLVGLALSRHQHALCTHVPAATCCQPQQTRHSGGAPSSCGFPAVAVSLAGAPITPPPPPMRRASLHLRAPPSTLTVEYKRRRNFSDFVRSSLLLPTLLLSSIVHANMHATTRRDKASLCSSLFASSRTVRCLLCQLKSLNAMQPTNGLSPKKEEEEKKGDEGKTRSFDPSSSETTRKKVENKEKTC